MSSEGEASVQRLVELAGSALHCPESDMDRFLALVDRYLDLLESWRSTLDPEGGKTDPAFRSQVEALNTVHQQLLQRAEIARAHVMSEMGEANKKAGALRAYVDRFPKRVTIAGKRKG